VKKILISESQLNYTIQKLYTTKFTYGVRTERCATYLISFILYHIARLFLHPSSVFIRIYRIFWTICISYVVSPMKSTKCKFANLVVSRKIVSRLTNLEGLTRMEQGDPDNSNESFANSHSAKKSIPDLEFSR